jgi:hypothetical protein
MKRSAKAGAMKGLKCKAIILMAAKQVSRADATVRAPCRL